MKHLKNRANRKGFTLVELIVVIAILAILAGVAIPVYSGYIKKANEAADLTQLDALKTAAVFAYTESQVKAGSTETTVTAISYTCDTNGQINAVTVNTNVTTLTDAIRTQMGGTFPTMKSDTYKAGGSWNGTAWSGTVNNAGGAGEGGEG